MATERYAGHIRVSDTASGNVVRHGRMGYKGVYGRMARPWFVKEEIPHGIIRRRGICVQRCITVNAVWYTQAGGCTKVSSSGIWYGKGGSGVPKSVRMGFGTAKAVLGYKTIIEQHPVHQTGLSGTEAWRWRENS